MRDILANGTARLPVDHQIRKKRQVPKRRVRQTYFRQYAIPNIIHVYQQFYVKQLTWIINSQRKIQQDATIYQNIIIPYLYEAQHVSGKTPSIIRSLKLHWQPLVFPTWKVLLILFLKTSINYMSNNLPRRKNQRLPVQF